MAQVDWSKVKFHPSSLYSIMAGSDKKTKMQIWEEACEEAIRKSQAYEKLKKKDGPRAAYLLEAIEKFEAIIPILHAQRLEREPISAGCKTYLSGVYAFQKYGKYSVNKDVGSRETQKGKEVEDESLALVSFLEGKKIIKNQERIEDDHFSGHPDAFEGVSIQNAFIIHDVKSPWDAETFFSYLNKDLPTVYYWQMQAYMALTNAPIAYVHFCLVDTPERFIKDVSDRILRNGEYISDLSPDFLLAQQEVISNMTFSDIPAMERRIKFPVERNDADILKAREQVERCRQYLELYEKIHLGIELPEKEVTLMQTDAE
jgi:hypothetical protein